MNLRKFSALWAIAFLIVSCHRQDSSQLEPIGLHNLSRPNAQRLLTDWDKEMWIEKASRALRLGHGITSADDFSKLKLMTPKEIVDYFMADPRFSDTVLDFNMYFLGYKSQGDLKDSRGVISGSVADFPSAITSAREAIKGTQYLKLLDYEQPFYLGAIPPLSKDQKVDGDIFSTALKKWDGIIAEAEKGLPGNRTATCALFAKDNPIIYAAGQGAMSFELALTLFTNPNWLLNFAGFCNADNFPPPDLIKLKSLREKFEKLFSYLGQHSSKLYAPKSVMEIIEADKEILDLGKTTTFSYKIWQDLPNSSTNYDRKRASYILKRYFCDDLTPLNIVLPDGFSGKRHGTQASCMACHYKLDPMAGFFRAKGVFGLDFSQSPLIVFDDRAVVNTRDYFKSWMAPEGSGRQWDVGYVRSLQFPQNNEYGESIEDLFKIIKKAPEVKRCLTKRMFEYFVGENQAIDAGYLDSLARDFEKEAYQDSSKAFKNTLAKIILSGTFSQQDPEVDQCYDYPEGVTPQGRPPCKAAFILQQNCVKCHSGSTPSKGLDLNGWIHLSDGTYSFPHKDLNGNQLSQKETFSRLRDRLTSADPAWRMPLGQFMKDEDRVQLVLWIEEILK